MLGYTETELKALGVLDVTHRDDVPTSAALMADLVSGRTNTVTFEKCCLKKSGEIVWTSVTVSAIRNEKGEMVAGIGQTADITERKQVEEALSAQEQRLTAIFQAVHAGIGFNVDRHVYQTNDRFLELTGYTRDEVIGQSTRMFYRDEAEYQRVGR